MAPDPTPNLIADAQRGNREALLAVIERYQGTVYRFSKRMCSNEHEAEDVMQDTLLTVIQKIGDYRGEASFTSWLFTIVRSACARKGRAQARVDPDEPGEIPDEVSQPDAQMGSGQLRTVLETALLALEPMYREVLLLRDVEGLTAPEVGEALGLTVAAVKSRLHRGRAMLRERIAASFGPHLPESPMPLRLPPGQNWGELISAYVEGDLTSAQCGEMEERLAQSPNCQGMCDLLRRILGECRSCGLDRPPEQLVESVRQAVRSLSPA